MKSPNLLGGPGGNGVGVGVGIGVGDSIGEETAVAVGVEVNLSLPIIGRKICALVVGEGVVVGTEVGEKRRHADINATQAAAPTPRRKSRRLKRRPDKSWSRSSWIEPSSVTEPHPIPSSC
jgi:hypothetical protein